MKYTLILVLTFLLGINGVQSQTIEWMSLAEALEAQKKRA